MKSKTLFLIGFFFSCITNTFATKQNNLASQEDNKKYFLIDLDATKKSEYNLSHVELNAKELYDTDKHVELFNLLSSNNKILTLFSILPGSSADLWSEINITSSKNKLISWKELNDFRISATQAYASSCNTQYEHLKRSDICLVKKEKGKYFKATNCITEFFFVENTPRMFNGQTDICTINITSQDLPLKEFDDKYQNLYRAPSPNYHDLPDLLRYPMDKPLLFLSKSSMVDDKKAYHFWGFMDWSISDQPNYRRGIDRFIFIPNLGIVGGSFDFYFDHLLDKIRKRENYLNEGVMKPLKIDGKNIK